MEAAAKTRVLVVGLGWLGQFLWRELSARADVAPFGTYLTHAPQWAPGDSVFRLDCTDAEAVEQALLRVRPDALVLLAAQSSPAACERDPAEATRVNCPAALIRAVRALLPNCLLLFTSTDLVYAGDAPPYAPLAPDLCAPANAYGASKLACERLVLAHPRSVVLRLSNVLGPSFAYSSAGGGKFLEWLHDACVRREYTGLRHDERRSFVFVGDVVRVIVALVTDGTVREPLLGRVLNVGGPEGLSRLQLAEVVAAELVAPEGRKRKAAASALQVGKRDLQ